MSKSLSQELARILEMKSPGFPVGSEPLLPARAAVIGLFSGNTLMDSEILLMKRSGEVAIHPHQIALPGGGVEEQDSGDLIRTALRETVEEVGLPEDSIMPLGLLPFLPTVSGGFFVAPVVAVARPGTRKLPLKLDKREVAFADWVQVAELVRTRSEGLHQVRGQTLCLPEFQWRGERMWGLTALIFDLILKRYDTLRS